MRLEKRGRIVQHYGPRLAPVPTERHVLGMVPQVAHVPRNRLKRRVHLYYPMRVEVTEKLALLNRLVPIVRHPAKGRPYRGEAKRYRLSTREPVAERLPRPMEANVSHVPRNRLVRTIETFYPARREEAAAPVEKIPETLVPQIVRYHRVGRARW